MNTLISGTCCWNAGSCKWLHTHGTGMTAGDGCRQPLNVQAPSDLSGFSFNTAGSGAKCTTGLDRATGRISGHGSSLNCSRARRGESDSPHRHSSGKIPVFQSFCEIAVALAWQHYEVQSAWRFRFSIKVIVLA